MTEHDEALFAKNLRRLIESNRKYEQHCAEVYAQRRAMGANILENYIQPDGSLEENETCSIYWFPHLDDATLDGEFNAAQLRAIADHMDAHRIPQPK